MVCGEVSCERKVSAARTSSGRTPACAKSVRHGPSPTTAAAVRRSRTRTPCASGARGLVRGRRGRVQSAETGAGRCHTMERVGYAAPPRASSPLRPKSRTHSFFPACAPADSEEGFGTVCHRRREQKKEEKRRRRMSASRAQLSHLLSRVLVGVCCDERRPEVFELERRDEARHPFQRLKLVVAEEQGDAAAGGRRLILPRVGGGRSGGLYAARCA